MSLSQQESWYKKEVFGQSSTNLQEIVNKAKYLDVVKMKEVLDDTESFGSVLYFTKFLDEVERPEQSK